MSTVTQQKLNGPNEICHPVDADIRKPLVVEISDFRGQRFLDVRHWYYTENGSLSRTKSGASIPMDAVLSTMQAMVAAYNEAMGGEVVAIAVDPDAVQ